MKHRSSLRYLLAAILLCGMALNAYAQEAASNEEYRVYEAALHLMDSTPRADLHVAIYDRTLNSKCGVAAGNAADNPVLSNGCTFLWRKPETPDDVEQILRTRWHGLSRAAWKNFKANNANSITLHDPLATPWKHRFTGTSLEMRSPGDDSKEWEAPDMRIYLSRVGFNSQKTVAVLYVLVFSYVDSVATTGDYLLFRADRRADRRAGEEKVWTLAGRMNYFAGAANSFTWLRPGTESGHGVPEMRLAAERK